MAALLLCLSDQLTLLSAQVWWGARHTCSGFSRSVGQGTSWRHWLATRCRTSRLAGEATGAAGSPVVPETVVLYQHGERSQNSILFTCAIVVSCCSCNQFRTLFRRRVDSSTGYLNTLVRQCTSWRYHETAYYQHVDLLEILLQHSCQYKTQFFQ